MPQSQSPSKLLTWLGYLAIALLLALPLSVVIVRSGMWQPGLLLYALACVGATILIAAFAILLLVPKYSDRRSAIAKNGVLVIPGAVLFGSLVASQGDFPPIHDISTDLIDPPTFSAAVKERGDANPLAIDPNNLSAQKQSYPDLTTLRNTRSTQDNFERALATAQELGWHIYHSDSEAGIIEAVDTTALMAFKDDVVIRVRAQGEDTLVDLRSVSRVGQADFGVNAERIRKFQSTFAP